MYVCVMRESMVGMITCMYVSRGIYGRHDTCMYVGCSNQVEELKGLVPIVNVDTIMGIFDNISWIMLQPSVGNLDNIIIDTRDTI